MNHYEEYKGHNFNVDTLDRGKGWTWEYQIDGGVIHKGSDRPLRSEKLALQEGIGNAKFAIDGMK